MNSAEHTHRLSLGRRRIGPSGFATNRRRLVGGFDETKGYGGQPMLLLDEKLGCDRTRSADARERRVGFSSGNAYRDVAPRSTRGSARSRTGRASQPATGITRSTMRSDAVAESLAVEAIVIRLTPICSGVPDLPHGPGPGVSLPRPSFAPPFDPRSFVSAISHLNRCGKTCSPASVRTRRPYVSPAPIHARTRLRDRLFDEPCLARVVACRRNGDTLPHRARRTVPLALLVGSVGAAPV